MNSFMGDMFSRIMCLMLSSFMYILGMSSFSPNKGELIGKRFLNKLHSFEDYSYIFFEVAHNIRLSAGSPLLELSMVYITSLWNQRVDEDAL